MLKYSTGVIVAYLIQGNERDSVMGILEAQIRPKSSKARIQTWTHKDRILLSSKVEKSEGYEVYPYA